MSIHRLALVLWTTALLATGFWWPISHRYGLGFTAAAPNPFASSSRRHRPECGIALVSGMGKGVFYLSWSSAFTRRGFICEPVIAHEFPHPWLGYQNEGGRLWVSFPLVGVFLLTAAGSAWHWRRQIQSAITGPKQ